MTVPMPGFGDTTFIVLLALLLFGPKKLPVLARQFGKLMADFRRASNEFRTQMEEELRISEQAERQKQIEAIESTAPRPAEVIPEPEHPHLPAPLAEGLEEHRISDPEDLAPAPEETTPGPLPIASSGGLNLMPPSTGLPVANTLSESTVEHASAIPEILTEANGTSNGVHSEPAPETSRSEARPWMI